MLGPGCRARGPPKIFWGCTAVSFVSLMTRLIFSHCRRRKRCLLTLCFFLFFIVAFVVLATCCAFFPHVFAYVYICMYVYVYSEGHESSSSLTSLRVMVDDFIQHTYLTRVRNTLSHKIAALCDGVCCSMSCSLLYFLFFNDACVYVCLCFIVCVVWLYSLSVCVYLCFVFRTFVSVCVCMCVSACVCIDPQAFAARGVGRRWGRRTYTHFRYRHTYTHTQ